MPTIGSLKRAPWIWIALLISWESTTGKSSIGGSALTDITTQTRCFWGISKLKPTAQWSMNGQWMVMIWMTPSLSPSSGPVAGRIKLAQWFPALLSDSAMPKYLSERHVQVYHLYHQETRHVLRSDNPESKQLILEQVRSKPWCAQLCLE